MTFNNYKTSLVLTVHIRNYDNQNNHNKMTAVFEILPQYDLDNEHFSFFLPRKQAHAASYIRHDLRSVSVERLVRQQKGS